jgi:hypothetical protein
MEPIRGQYAAAQVAVTQGGIYVYVCTVFILMEGTVVHLHVVAFWVS